MKLVWIVGLTLNLISFIYAGPIEVVYSNTDGGNDGCDCQARPSAGYQIPPAKCPFSTPYQPPSYGYKIDVPPPVQTKAKVTYTFDFTVEEPKPKVPPTKKQEKLNLRAKVDRIALKKADCQDAYNIPSHAYPPPQQDAYPQSPCQCGQNGPPAKHLYRYVDDGQLIQPCRCRRPACQCHLQSPNAISVGNPVLVASATSSHASRRANSRRKRDLEDMFFRPRRQERARSARYIKLYNKPIDDTKDPKEDWLNLDFFSDSLALKRKPKRASYRDLSSRIVKRDIKGEYDLMEKERHKVDLTLPEIVQYMPEVLNPNFKRGPCRFGCGNKSRQSKSEEEKADEEKYEEILSEINRRYDQIESSSTPSTPSTVEDSDGDEQNDIPKAFNSFTKRNTNAWGPPSEPAQPSDVASPQPNDYGAQNAYDQENLSAAELCRQRKLYTAMRRSADSQNSYNDEAYKITPPPLIPAPEPLLGAPRYPTQTISNALLDRIISEIVYKHPGFLDATAHYNGAMIDPAPDQVDQTKSFIKKLIDGRVGMLFDKPEEPYLPGIGGPPYSPYSYPRTISYVPHYYPR